MRFVRSGGRSEERGRSARASDRPHSAVGMALWRLGVLRLSVSPVGAACDSEALHVLYVCIELASGTLSVLQECHL